MGNNAGRISMWRKCVSRPKDAESFQSLADYCREQFVTPTVIRRKIQAKKIRAFKFKGKWYVKDYEDSRYLTDYP